jgi:hypothetical protein
VLTMTGMADKCSASQLGSMRKARPGGCFQVPIRWLCLGKKGFSDDTRCVEGRAVPQGPGGGMVVTSDES